VSIGVAPSKTLAKMAATLAKKSESGVFHISTREIHAKVLKDFPLSDIWGIGAGLKARLNARNIHTAWELYAQNPITIKRFLGVVGERIVWELRGKSCLPLEKAKSKKSITTSRSFGETVSSLEELSEALATYTNKACVKLRKQKSSAHAICVYAEAVIDSQTYLRRHDSKVVDLLYPTSDTPHIIEKATQCLKELYRENQRYKKCGIILLDLIPKDQVMPDMFLQTIDPKRDRLSEVYDHVNSRFGRNSLFYAAMGINNSWKMRNESRSGHYTTSWDELAIAKA
jgi:DNA polymerase V